MRYLLERLTNLEKKSPLLKSYLLSSHGLKDPDELNWIGDWSRSDEAHQKVTTFYRRRIENFQ